MIRFTAVAALLLATLFACMGAEGAWRLHSDRFVEWVGGGLASLAVAAVLSKDETAGIRWLGRIFVVLFVLYVGLMVAGPRLREAQLRATDNAFAVPKLSGKVEVDASLLTMPPAEREQTLDEIEAMALGAQYGFDTEAAQKAGYSSQQIIKEIARKAAAAGQHPTAAR